MSRGINFLIVGFLSAAFCSFVSSADTHRNDGKWITTPSFAEKISPFHTEVGAGVQKVKSLQGIQDRTNVAVFGITLHLKDKSKVWKAFPLFTLSSGITLRMDASLKTSEIVPPGGMIKEILAIRSLFQPMSPEISGSLRDAPDKIRSCLDPVSNTADRNEEVLLFVRDLIRLHTSSPIVELWQLPGIERRLSLYRQSERADLSVALVPLSRNYGAGDNDLPQVQKSIDACFSEIFHCEQIMLYVLRQPNNHYLESIIDHILRENSKLSLENIESISFDIVTYNDMCWKCLESVKKSHSVLKKAILERLRLDVPFYIIISSFRPFQNQNAGVLTGWTRPQESGGILPENRCEEGFIPQVFQFINPYGSGPEEQKLIRPTTH